MIIREGFPVPRIKLGRLEIGGGLMYCHRLKHLMTVPRIIIRSNYTDCCNRYNPYSSFGIKWLISFYIRWWKYYEN